MDVGKKLDNRHLAHWEVQPGFLYFVGAGTPPVAIKIGISTQGTIRRRLRSLQSSNHEPLHILGLIPFEDIEKPMAAANRLELELHEEFAANRRLIDGPGNEWFNASEELLTAISERAQPARVFSIPECVATIGPGLRGDA